MAIRMTAVSCVLYCYTDCAHLIYLIQLISADMYSQIRQGVASNIRCYGSCKGATVHTTTWCVHVYSTGEPVEVCLNSSGIVSETSAAVLLGLKNVLRIAVSSAGRT